MNIWGILITLCLINYGVGFIIIMIKIIERRREARKEAEEFKNYDKY